MEFGIASVAAITVIVYLIGAVAKAVGLANKWISIICGVTGLILGVVALYIHMPDFPASDPINAAAIGIASGFAATGVNRCIQQRKDP